MSEYLRSVVVRIEVDTNKQTVTLDESYDSIMEAARAVSEFLGQCVADL